MIREEEIGPAIRRLRERKGWSLQELAAATGFTKGYLSKIENAGKAPPVSTLLALARAFQVDISEFFGQGGSPSRFHLLRKGERSVVSRDSSEFGYAYEPLAPGYTTKRMEPFVIRVPRQPHAEGIFQHRGEEMLLVLKGVLRFFFGDVAHELREGDCVYFDSSVPHRGVSLGDSEAECLVVIYSEQ